MRSKKKSAFVVLGALSTLGASISINVAAEGGLEEVMVTAERRTESVQDASISIDVISADALDKAGLTNAYDLSAITPGVQISPGGNALQIYIRGAGDFTTTAYSNAAVVPSFDGVSAARTQFVTGQFYDLERIEILKGPQGTLYGRNAVGGVINLIPAKPNFDEFSGYVKAGLQNYSGKSLEGAFNIPTSDTSALRASYQIVDREGYIDDGTNDDEHSSLRLQYLTELGENTSVRLAGHYTDFGGRGQGKVVWAPNGTAFSGIPGMSTVTPGDPWTSIQQSLTEQNNFMNNVVFAGSGSPVRIADFDTQDVQQDVQIWGVHAEIEMDLDIGMLTVLPAYQYVENNSTSIPGLGFSTTNSGTGAPSTSDGTSLEVRLADQTGKLDWVLGAFYFNEDQESNNYLNIANVANFDYTADLNTESYALFVDTNYSFNDKLRGILGVRYTDESKTMDAAQYHVAGRSIFCPLGAGTGPGGNCDFVFRKGNYDDTKITYRLGVEYDINDDSMVFATLATGFKSGGIVNADVDPYRAEDLTAFTLGSKNIFLDGTLQFNAEIFYWDYKNHQENVATLDRTGSRASVLLNAGTAHSKGFSLDTVYVPDDNNYFRFAIEYVNSKYDEFIYNEYSRVPSNECVQTPLPAASAPATLRIDCSGLQMARTPEWSGSLAYTRTFNMGSGAKIELSPSVTFASSRWLSAEFNKNQLAKSYEVFNLSAVYISAEEDFTVQLFARNIGDEAVYTGSRTAAFVPDYATQDIAAPRTYGISVRKNF